MSSSTSQSQKNPDDLTVELRKIISGILNIPAEGKWSVTSSLYEENKSMDAGDLPYLVSVSYDSSNDIYGTPIDMELSEIRGIIINIEEKNILCTSYGFPSITNVKQFSSYMDAENTYMLLNLDNEKNLNFRNYQLVPYIEGCVYIRIFRIKGKTYFSNFRRLDLEEKNHEGEYISKIEGIPFIEIFKEATSGLTGKDFFDENYESSRYWYNFLCVHPKLCISTRQKINALYAIYMGKRKMISDNNNRAAIFNKKFDTNLNNEINASKIIDFDNGEMDPENALQFLNYGFFGHTEKDFGNSDPRQWLGESLHITGELRDDKGEWKMKTKKLSNISSLFRDHITGRKINIEYQLHYNMDQARKHFGDNKKIMVNSVPYPNYNLSTVKKHIKENNGLSSFNLIEINKKSWDIYRSLEQLEKNYFYNHLICLSHNKQMRLIKAYEFYLTEREYLENTIKNIEISEDLPDKLKKFIQNQYKNSKDKHSLFFNMKSTKVYSLRVKLDRYIKNKNEKLKLDKNIIST